MQNEPKLDQPFLQGSDHLTAIYEANQNVVENKPSVLENVSTKVVLIDTGDGCCRRFMLVTTSRC